MYKYELSRLLKDIDIYLNVYIDRSIETETGVSYFIVEIQGGDTYWNYWVWNSSLEAIFNSPLVDMPLYLREDEDSCTEVLPNLEVIDKDTEAFLSIVARKRLELGV